jgi:hypothetical protein
MISPTKTRILAVCSIASALVVVWMPAIALQRSPDTHAATAAQCLDRAALALFQFARSNDDLLAVFRPADSPCRPLIVEALEATQQADLHVLILAYSIFFIAAALALAGPSSRWAWSVSAATLVAAAANISRTGFSCRSSHRSTELRASLSPCTSRH